MRDADVDRLFQLPTQEFTKARNALAAEAGSQGAAIRRLQKPPIAAWAVNQLFWKRRAVYDALVESAETLRHAHKAVLTGRHGDIRGANQAHDQALDAALKETLALASSAGHKITDATRQAIAQTLRALPSAESPGRLTHALQPGGFEMLAGITPTGRGVTQRAARPEPAVKAAPATTRTAKRSEAGVSARELARAKENAASAARALREAEQRARREEFEKARTAREAEKARGQLEAAREALADAEKTVAEAERALAAADRARDAAGRRAEESAAAVAAARDRAEAAQAALDAVKSPSSRGR
jgi:hypothetical protein